MRWIKTPDPKTTRNKPATKIDMERLAQDIKNYSLRVSVRARQTVGCQQARH
jgi:hypothetical protein